MAGRRAQPRDLPYWLVWAIPIAVLAVLAVGFVLTRGAVDAESTSTALQGDNTVLAEQRDATADQALRAADPVLDLCDDNSDVGEALRADLRNPCGLAEQVRANPVVGPAGPRGPGPTVQQIRDAVADYLVLNPPAAGRAPTPGEVAAAVTTYLTAHPPAPGRAPTTAEIAGAVETYFRTNPVQDGTDGADGTDGEPGRPPTAQEIQAAVNSYVADNPPARGAQGAQGVGVQSVRTERRDADCVLVFVLSDPATGELTDQAVIIADQVCEAGPIDAIPEEGTGG